MNRFQYKLLSVSMAVLLLASMALVGREAAIYAASMQDMGEMIRARWESTEPGRKISTFRWRSA